MGLPRLDRDHQALSRFDREGPFVWLWEPTATAVVLGAGTPLEDVYLDRCTAEGVPVYRRRGGGGAVVLSPGSLIITACFDAGRKAFPTQWIEPTATAIRDALKVLGVGDVRLRGSGDVTIGDRKVLGSSIYATRKSILYQGCLLVGPDLDLIPRYLPHPSQEPAYRQRRCHRTFLTSLEQAGYSFARQVLVEALKAHLQKV